MSNNKIYNDILDFNANVKKRIYDLSVNEYKTVNTDFLMNVGFGGLVLPRYNADLIIEQLCLDSLYSKCVKVLVSDVFKDYRVIGKVKKKMNNVEEFIEKSNLISSLRLAYEDSLSYGYGCLLIKRDKLGNIKRFHHLASNSVAVIFDENQNKKYVQRSFGEINNYFNVYGDDLFDSTKDEVFMFNDYYIKDPIFGLGTGVKLAGFIELKKYMESMVLGTLLKGIVRPQLLINVKANIDEDSGEIGSKLTSKDLELAREKTNSAVNNGLNEGDHIVLSTDNTEILLDVLQLKIENNSKDALDIADYLENQIMKAFGVPATRLTAFKTGVFSGNLTKESLEMYGFNTILNIQREFEIIINKFIKDFLGELGKRVGSVEVELERYKTDFEQVEKFDEENKIAVVEDNEVN